MPIFKSSQPPIEVPWHLPIWTWLFDSEYSPLRRYKLEEIKGYTNAVTKEHLNYTDLKLLTTYLSTALVKRYGFQHGQTVCIFSPNTVWYPCVMFGTLRAGGVVSGASPAYNVEELTFALKTAEARFLFTTPSNIPVAAAAARTVGIPQNHIFLIYGEMQNFTMLTELLNIGRSYDTWGQVEQFRIPPNKQNKDICGFLSFSSGTTGLPKAVMVAHSNIIAQCLQVSRMTPDSLRRILAVLPLFHITGLIHHLHLPILLNANVYLLPNFTLESTLQCIQDYQLEEVLLVPPILIRMVRHAPLLRRYDLGSLRRFMSGAAPLSAEILALLRQHFPNTGFKQGYGMTESCSCITLHPPDKYDYKYATRVGTIVPSTEVKFVDPQTGKECGLNEPGEIWARGPQVVMGYLNNKKATDETFDDEGFLHTGDIGSIDEEGMVAITDRLKEMIKVNGIGVAPAELEDLLLGHEDVEDVAVLGVADDSSGEHPKAYVVPKLPKQKHGNLDAVRKRLIEYVQERKARYKWITEIEFIDEIPKSASGKILRRVLRDTMSRSKVDDIGSEGNTRAAKL